MNKEIIPEQFSGGKSDTVSEASFDDQEQAKQFFEVARQRLFNVNSWNHYSGLEAAKFSLRDPQGNNVDRAPQQGDYFCISLPVPDNEESEGDDWVQVEEIGDEQHEAEALIFIRVKTKPSPLAGSGETAHFYSHDATSTFLVRREGKKVYAEVHGRNIKPNTKEVGLLAKIRNTLVALGGMIGGSKIMWKSLTNGLVETDK